MLGWCGCLLLAAYVVPLYFPPGPVEMLRPGPDTGLLTRLFPDVPRWWVVGRLTALAVGAVLLAWAARDGEAPRPLHLARSSGRARSWLPADRHEWAALILALLLVVAAAWASSFPRWAQIAFVLAPILPIALLRVSDTRDGSVPQNLDRVAPGWWAAVALLVAGWVVWRVGLASHDPRAADFVDMWLNFSYFVDAATKPSNLLTQQAEPGVSNVYMLGLGIPFLGPGGFEPSFVWVQRVHGLWIALTAAGVACLARRFAGPAAMLPAVAVLLFSPFMMSMAVAAVPFGFTTALAAGLVLLVCRIYESHSRADVAALGTLAGFSATYPHLTLFALGATLAVLPCMRRSAPSLSVWATAALIGTAAIVPMLASLAKLSTMSELYLHRRGVVAELEPLIRGQKYFELPEIDALWHAGERGVLDVPLGALLQPFAIPRTPVRLSGDVYYEPIGAALAAVGLAACVGLARRAAAARFLLGAMIVAIVPGAATSAFDRPSLTRNLAVSVLLPVFTVIGVAVARRALGARLRAGRVLTALALAITVSGAVIFDVVNPRIVAGSWLGLALRALESTPAGRTMLLEHGHPRRWWLHVPEIARYVPPTPLRTRPYRNAGSLLSDPDGHAPAAPLLVWSPALEEEESLQRNVCGCWPDATLYVLHDRAGLSRVLAARLEGDRWEPALPALQWSASACLPELRTGMSCETLRAMAHYNEAGTAAAAHRPAEAIAHYRAALDLEPDFADARHELGSTLAAGGRFDEAIAEFRTLLRAQPALASVHNSLAIALESAGQVDDAIAEYREAVRLAPAEPRGRLNLAAVLGGRGRVDDAMAEYREVLRQLPDLPEAHLGLAHAFTLQRRPGDAIAEYRAALRVRPGWVPAAQGLAWLLATSDDPALRNPGEAVSLATQAADDDGGRDAGTLRTLAVAYAAAGRFQEAVATAERGLQAARASNQDDLARDLDERLAAYRSGRASP